MNRETLNKIAVVGILVVLTAAFFYQRVDIYRQSDVRSVDEYVFYNLGLQIMEDINKYNTIPYGTFLKNRGRPLPSYFFAPLFKHPPVFAGLICGSLKLFGTDGDIVGGYVPALMGALLIPLTYLLARMFLSPALSLLAAFIVSLDPVVVMCSQKIWMGTTIAFLTLLAVYFFLKALKHENNSYFILSGITAGLLLNTKYTGVLFPCSALLFFLIYQRDAFRKNSVRLFFALPFLMLIPWLAWNAHVYGPGAVLRHPEIQRVLKIAGANLVYLIPLLLGSVYLWIVLKRRRLETGPSPFSSSLARQTSRFRLAAQSVILIVFFGILWENVVHSLSWNYIPTASWGQLFTSSQPGYFYFGRLLEYSFVYFFSFLTLLIYQPGEDCDLSFLRINAFLIILFFSAWGAYQSRYVIAAVPLLIVLGMRMWSRLIARCEDLPGALPVLGRVLLVGILAYALTRTEMINLALSYTNDMCYF